MDETRLSTFAQGVGVGIVVGALLALLVGPGLSGGGAAVSVPSQSSSVGSGCTPELPADRGWATVVGTPSAGVVALNLTVTHPAPNRTVRPALREAGDGTFVYALESVETGKDPETGGDCRSHSTVDASLALPRDFQRVRIVYDGERVATVRNSGDRTATRQRLNTTG